MNYSDTPRNENFHVFWLENKQCPTVTPLQTDNKKHDLFTVIHKETDFMDVKAGANYSVGEDCPKYISSNKHMHRCNQLTLKLALTTTPYSHTNNRTTIF